VFEREIARIDIALLALQNTRLALRALPLHLARRPLQKIARRTREMLSLRKFYAARIARNAAQEGA
jgi:hypothetical protein